MRKIALFLLLALALPAATAAEIRPEAAALDEALAWDDARLLIVQANARFETLEAFARESFATMTGREHLPGLAPVASVFEWVFNGAAYADTPLVKVRSSGLRGQLATLFEGEQRDRIVKAGRMSPNELRLPHVTALLAELEVQSRYRKSVGEVRHAQQIATDLNQLLAVVPAWGAGATAPWAPPLRTLSSLDDERLAEFGIARDQLPAVAFPPVPGITEEAALAWTRVWSTLRAGWLAGDAETVQAALDDLVALQGAMVEPGSTPGRAQRAAEVRYYRSGKFTYGWLLYFFALLVSVWALVSGWWRVWAAALVLLVPALALHVYGLSLRWFILGRIPVGNIFEAVVASTAIGIFIALLIELARGTRVLLVGASAVGFAALLAAQYVLPGGELEMLPAILDDVQLRIHTVTIITAYALTFVAAVIALVYLAGYAIARWRGHTLSDGTISGSAAAWLRDVDATHLMLLHLIFVLLFVGGLALGAAWADYAWGRPWGWDAKEVFALNTWLIYAILIHVRYVVRQRGLWTAGLSLAGCAMVSFNWFIVNFYIVSIHSYA
jgi:ABC-type transport system involved in cytochrome c biogenesis permease subunit